jgi:hypothetical protein
MVPLGGENVAGEVQVKPIWTEAPLFGTKSFETVKVPTAWFTIVQAPVDSVALQPDPT